MSILNLMSFTVQLSCLKTVLTHQWCCGSLLCSEPGDMAKSGTSQPLQQHNSGCSAAHMLHVKASHSACTIWKDRNHWTSSFILHMFTSWTQHTPLHSSSAKVNFLSHHGQYVFPASKRVLWNQHPCRRSQDIAIGKNAAKQNRIWCLGTQSTHLCFQNWRLTTCEEIRCH